MMILDVVKQEPVDMSGSWSDQVSIGVEFMLKGKIGESIAPGRMQGFHESLQDLDAQFANLAQDIWDDPHDPEKKQILGNANMIALGITGEMVRSLSSKTEDGITSEQKVSFYTKAIKAMGKIIGIQLALRNPERVQQLADLQLLTMSDWDNLHNQ